MVRDGMIRFLEGSQQDGLGIPYPSRKDSDTNNVGYLDLKASPSNIDAIYELDGWPEFKKLVKAVNHVDSFFRSLRCDVWYANVTGHPVFRVLAVGYITVAFEILEYNCSRRCFDELRNQFLRFAPHVTKWTEVTINFRHVPTSYRNHLANSAWSEDIEIQGFGRTEDEARRAFLTGLNPVAAFLIRESIKYPEELKKGRKTLG
jgi:hypothetical protein